MSFVTDIVGEITGTKDQADAAREAAGIQAGAAREGISEQRRQFDKLIELMAPYVAAGKPALNAQQNLIGLGEPGSQKTAIDQLLAGPEFAAYTQQGENALLQNASATGGLRGGNLQGALAQFRPRLLSDLIQQRFQNLGSITSLGQNSAAMQGNAGMATGQSIADLLGQAGAAQAGGVIAAGNQRANAFGNLMTLGSTAASLYAGLPSLSSFGGSAPATTTSITGGTGAPYSTPFSSPFL